MQSLSVAIVACNEAENIRRTLASVAWANEINLVDSGSIDQTVEIFLCAMIALTFPLTFIFVF